MALSQAYAGVRPVIRPVIRAVRPLCLATSLLATPALTFSQTSGTRSLSDVVDTIDISTMSQDGAGLCTHVAGGVSVSFPCQADTVDPDTDLSALLVQLSGTSLSVTVEEDAVSLSDTVDLSAFLDDTIDASTLVSNGDGTCTHGAGGAATTFPCAPAPAPVTLTAKITPLMECETIWAEESGNLNTNQAQWSFGNGATGVIGLPYGGEWLVTELGFQADIFANTATVSVDLMNYASGSAAAANAIASIALSGASDGGGVANNAFKRVELAPPVAVPDPAVLGFFTRAKSGTISDARVSARLCRQVGTYISDLSSDQPLVSVTLQAAP